ncbi:hypothetical protein BD413DRAFT_93286 [Trametes elegans]|nr:hypothetical protein BD413DRAFT_93286 [Trametes elegans]
MSPPVASPSPSHTVPSAGPHDAAHTTRVRSSPPLRRLVSQPALQAHTARTARFHAPRPYTLPPPPHVLTQPRARSLTPCFPPMPPSSSSVPLPSSSFFNSLCLSYTSPRYCTIPPLLHHPPVTAHPPSPCSCALSSPCLQ